MAVVQVRGSTHRTSVSNRGAHQSAEPFETAQVDRAIILAAGIGARLAPATSASPKCLVEVNGVPLLHRTLGALADAKVTEAVIVVGHQAEKVKQLVGTTFAGVRIRYVEAPRFRTTNNICSLWDARAFCDRDILLIEGDVVFEPGVIPALMGIPGSSMAVAPYEGSLSGTVVWCDEGDNVTAFALGEDQHCGFDYADTFKTVNIYLLRAGLLRSLVLPELEERIEQGNVHEFYESILRDLVTRGSLTNLRAVDVSAKRWYEVDNHWDLENAEHLFLSPDAQWERMQDLHGSYWRYGLADHAHPGLNPHFPPSELMENLRSELGQIVTSYPVGQSALARLVGNWTGADPGCVVVGNGASELVKVIGDNYVDRLCIPVPTFTEYENVVGVDRIRLFPLHPPTFDLNVESFGDAVVASSSDFAAVITPNLPTARSVSQTGIIWLAEHLAQHGCRLIVDESFIEYSHVGAQGSMSTLIEDHPNLVVLKSMGKVFGVPGLRLGYLLSSDQAFVAAMRTRLPIWNVNGLAEAFLRQIGAYRGKFDESCVQVRNSYMALYRQLCDVPGIQALAPDADFVLCKVTNPGTSAPEVARQLYVQHQIMVRDCSRMTMPQAERYLRIASRTAPENERLVGALASLDLG